ncbi:potassium-transporting ATPase subunit A [Luteolibacter pohnpeiensis]|uniref:Potassium-transporting ATPase potassium-binding subunit n=1 Tax=Luteolibacter pohnpeiensis TaxID=454153 RepID=A0A934VY67_9BACT|nr:potassium-transporting ATPase subunit KdpA [Luteolibacter pohnpeiensis]MBK1884573.1 potassium-transporting ATPase subunit A [Luteolibacter pohnpeiensis]
MNPLIHSILLVAGIVLLAWPAGTWLTWVLKTRRLDGIFSAALGKGILNPTSWKTYFLHLLGFNALMFVTTWIVLANQQHLPLNPDGLGNVPWHLVFNTSVSFVTNTNLQHYSGEATYSYLSQLTLMWLQFTSAATGIAAFAGLARGLAGNRDFGNFTHDIVRILLLFLLPIAFIWAILFAISGVPMTFEGAAIATTLEGASQTIARGPVAAFLAIKQLGTNGGGFFGPNSTHPLENPNLFSNILSMIAIAVIPMACVKAFGSLTGKEKHARIIGAVMLAFLLIKVTITVLPESAPTAAFANLPVAESANLEGKELRLGASTGPLWAVLTTSTSNGSVGAMHDSLNPISLLGPFSGMWLNSTFGGVGVGMINFFLFMVLAVFIAGLMIGRTPEYLGKKVEAREMALAAAGFIVHPLLILGGTALFAATPWGADTIHNSGPRGFSEILYEFSSAAANNGSGLEGLGDGTIAWNIATGIVMLLGRYLPILLPLAIAGALAAKPAVAESAGTLRTDTPTFGFMTFAVILFLGALTFLPVAMLGPILEHLIH